MKHLLFMLFSFFIFCASAQSNNNVKELVNLYKQNDINQKRIDEILNSDPELKKLLNIASRDKEKEETTKSKKFEFSEEFLKMEGVRIKKLLSQDNFDYIKNLFYSIQDSDYAKDISYIIIRQMEIARDELKEGIQQLPQPNKN